MTYRNILGCETYRSSSIAPESNSCLNTNNLRKLVRIKDGKPKVRRTMIERVAGCSKDLEEFTQTKKHPKPTLEPATKKGGGHTTLPSSMI